MADNNFLFPSTLGESQTQTLGGSVIRSFALGHIFEELEPFSMANTNYPFLSTLGESQTQTLGGSVIVSLALGCIFGELEPFY